MKPGEIISKCGHSDSLFWLPRKMIALHGNENVSEFVLHELCQPRCFNLKKAAYFIDNPDFDCLKGVAGINQDEMIAFDDVWQKPEEFSLYMRQSPFNQKVRSLNRSSAKKTSFEADKDLAIDVAHELGIANIGYCSWTSKHDNHGILVFEKNTDQGQVDKEELLNGFSLLSFCPIY
jgi:hypothetical protein